MAPYYPIQICRSDGVQQFILNGTLTANEPSKLDDTPNDKGVVNYYKRLDSNDAKSIEWRRKLGGMLMELLGEAEHADKDFVLKELPEGYVLWLHLGYNTGQEPGTQRNSHAAAGLDRSDTYLFGHPGGKTKKYRSPQDFFPHLLWLATDPDGKSENCSCKLCYPKDTAPVVKAPPKKEAKPLSTAQQNNTDEVPIPKPPPTTSIARPLKSPEQALDSDADSLYLFRPGELIWFRKGTAWGLAVICKRQIAQSQPRYHIQPLSHPLRHPSSQIKPQDDLRPWLAWSVPSTTHAQISQLSFDQVPWDRVVTGEFGGGDAEVDGSILSAKSIDGSYTLFERLDIPTALPGEVYYSGMFLGAEKIWVGEPVRLRVVGGDVVIMVTQQMMEKTVSSSSHVTIVGDVYKFVDMPTPYSNRNDWPTPDLPARMVSDLRFRNEVADNARKGVWYEWRLLEPMARKGLSDIKGRWYETRRLLPNLQGSAVFQQQISRGEATDAGILMNARGDSSGGGGQRKKNRLDTLGRAVPQDLKISRGLNGPAADNLFPDEAAAAPQFNTPLAPQYGSGGAGSGGASQALNLNNGTLQQGFYSNTMQH